MGTLYHDMSKEECIQPIIADDRERCKSAAENPSSGRGLQRAGRWGAGFLLLVLLAGSGWLHYQSYRQGLQQQALLAVITAEAAQQQAQQQRLHRRVDQQNERLLQAQQISAQQAQQLSTLRQRLLGLSARSRDDQRLLELRNLLSAAGHQLWLLHNVEAARRLLQGGADLLATLHNPALLPLRQALAEDRRQLAALELPDQETLVLQLLDDLAGINHLPLANPSPITVEEPVAASSAPETTGWVQRLLHQGRRLLQRLITVQREQATGRPAAPATAAITRERLSTYLHLALQAALQQRWADYQHYLSRGCSLLQEQFECQDPQVLTLLSHLQQRQQSPPPELPQQLQSQILLESFLQRWWGEPQRLASPSETVH